MPTLNSFSSWSLFIIFTLVGVVAGKPTRQLTVPGIFVFGDSLVDVGNNHYLNVSDLYKAMSPPYGIDFPGHIPTGRFSNGYNGIDFIGIFQSSVYLIL